MHYSFSSLLALFEPFFEKYAPHVNLSYGGFIRRIMSPIRGKRLGQPRKVTVIVLGLVLAWTRTRGSYKVFQKKIGKLNEPN
jgi:hypothetical protein